MKLVLRTAAGLGSLAAVLFVAGTMARGPGSPGAVPTESAAGTTAAGRPVAVPTTPRLPTPRPTTGCDGTTDRVALFVFPFRPRAGEPVRLVGVSREHLAPVAAEVDGARVEATAQWGPGPYGWEFRLDGLPAGTHVARAVTTEGRSLGCARWSVAEASSEPVRSVAGPEAWPVARAWSATFEDLYSVWVARLFAVPEDFRGGWHRLHAVFRDAERNLLHDALGWDEDGTAAARGGPSAIRARADCGDLPYTLRAYFAWKFGLPFRFQRCNRRNALVGAECYEERTNLTDRFASIDDPVERFNRFLEAWVAPGVHSATPRTLPEDGTSDFYPIEMSRAALRPGTVYVWPYGHLLVISDWHEDPVGGLSLVAVDGHPDGTLTFKRFSPRNFPYLPGLRTAGFKAFRPVVAVADEVRPVDDVRRVEQTTGLPFSEEQYRFRRSTDFYRAVQQVSALFVPEDPGT
ncbi:MAG: hypothetical protein JXB32_11475 [Deltaproteobacteria bacterium]|nr:hypothetical protein [Deltaproteobacteria bacterium]